jgi:hypothetical protein
MAHPRATAAKTAFFTKAQGFNIHDSNFTNNQTTIIQSPAPVVDPLEILHNHRALEACHTSKTAASAPKCKPGTRTKAIMDLTAWAKEVAADPSSSKKLVLWLRGPAGSGKTCIMREVARICRQNGLLAGDYFFSTRVPGLDNEAPFVATIASNLIIVVPALDHQVQKTIRLNPKIFEQSLEFQMEELILKHIASIPPQAPRILVVDGFDECQDQTQRARLLHLLYSLVTPPHSFRVIMASRPEYDIRTAFNQAPLKSITKILRLEEYEVSGEIYQYLSDEFARIRENHPAKQSIPSDWPGEATLRALTDKSSGIWAYPSTVIKYVDNPRRRPEELLGDVLDASSTASSGRPFAELDTLYKIILSPPDIDILLMKRLLHVIIEITRTETEFMDPGYFKELTQQILSAPCLDEFLSLGKGMTEITLCDLHSVLSVAEDVNRPWIYFHHKSLEDYLCSPERAGDLYQSQEDTHFDILTVSIHNLKLWNWKLVSPNADFQTVDPILDYSGVVLKQFFVKKCFPPSVLDFDARIVWRCFAFVGRRPPEQGGFNDFVNSFHNAMVGWIDLFCQLDHAHTCFFHHLVQSGSGIAGMSAVLRVVQAYA